MDAGNMLARGNSFFGVVVVSTDGFAMHPALHVLQVYITKKMPWLTCTCAIKQFTLS